MSRILAASALALSLVAGVTGAASAQSYTAPAGIPSVTAPGGLDGFAASTPQRRFDRSAPGAVSGGDIATTGSIRASQAVRARTAR
ncbi:hypothetical protein [Methylobacterium sp. J-090]|uniref:hypothetical protein n=1 Tax=Methylobacterium sp. J-090 TaxID=2836666 RepID=UPI001FB98E7A|nr:hypothetical protein [Methylobacterium sp. J-090]MCJ2082609.1 hypothetical protein [Methylobacterium sp. J-090]